MSKLLILAALPEEFPKDLVNPDMVIYTGVGKINAAIAATTAIIEYQPDLIINFGTAGSYDHALSGIVECGIFMDKDDKYNNDMIVHDISEQVVWTSDSFAIVNTGLYRGLADMEAFAIAKACDVFKVKFKCYKFITDYVGNNSLKEWESKASDGAVHFRKILDDYL